jgi:hypothetical protein
MNISWAIPTEEALLEIATHGPIVEMGAGMGYWAHLLRYIGVDIIAYDRYDPFGINPWHVGGNLFTFISRGDPRDLKQYRDRSLFLCWPPMEQPLAPESKRHMVAKDCLKYWKGQTLIYVGDFNGMTAGASFYKVLRKNFILSKTVEIPRWFERDDMMTIWTRKSD